MSEKGLPTHYAPIPYSDSPEFNSAEFQTLAPETHRTRERRSCKRRLLRLISFALCVFLIVKLAGVFTHGCHQLMQLKTSIYDKWHIPPHLQTEECAPWHDHNDDESMEVTSKSHTFKIPVDSESISLLFRGPILDPSSLRVVQSDEVSDSVQVDVKATYEESWVLEHVLVCEVKDRHHENKRGVGIFTHRQGIPRHYHPALEFSIVVTVPKGKDGAVVKIKDFNTALPLFSHYFADLSETVTFDKLTLNGAVSPFVADSLSGNFVQLRNAQGPITGTFNASRFLRLATADAPIRANVSLFNVHYPEPVELKMETANAEIASNVSLFAGEGKDESRFDVAANTAQGRVDVAFPDAPVNSTLRVRAHSVNAPVGVALHPTFEGGFRLSTVMASTKVDYDENAKDPAGRKRKRWVQFDRVGGWKTQGSVRWGNEEGKGWADLATAVGDVTLRL